MKKIVKIAAALMAGSLLFGSVASAATMYAPDGRTAKVAESDRAAWKKVGWYDVPVTVMYAYDGRTAVVAKTDVEAWKKVGWHTKNYKTMYALDGRTAKVALKDVSAWKKVGWYDVPVTMMYSFNGKKEVVAQSDVSAWESVGWYSSERDLFRKVANLAISSDWGYDFARYVGLYYSCVDLGDYYVFMGYSTRNADGEIWYKVYKNNSRVEKLFEGSDTSSFPLAQYIWNNYPYLEEYRF